ncbi:pseudouridylate synthase [Permianibacter sp. IMCC34836]|uniref:pseudouridine synthase n=1 Tax=Permianibacter fluminis TaxID=2738515 RepID=UPI0015542D25|nr:pseudouridine synthase [Permianibacter fluminis]NQD37720.1 pseudouridylate synthase [Permianibacter fluminis]
MSETLPILFQDEYLIAVHKPAGLLVHRSGIDRHETRFAMQLVRDQIRQHVYPVHRLDKGTSGVLLFALSSALAAELMQRFADQQIAKRYWAVVRGHPPAQGRIEYALGRIRDGYDDHKADDDKADDRGANHGRVEVTSTELAQPAITDYRRLATIELPFAVDRYPASRYALLELSPLTGRQHQIRRHLKHIAHPIIGDVRYGKGNHNRYFREVLLAPRLLLACVEMRLLHPVTAAPLVLAQNVDGVFRTLLQRWQWPTEVQAVNPEQCH